jgi:hypothetical protein
MWESVRRRVFVHHRPTRRPAESYVKSVISYSVCVKRRTRGELNPSVSHSLSPCFLRLLPLNGSDEWTIWRRCHRARRECNGSLRRNQRQRQKLESGQCRNPEIAPIHLPKQTDDEYSFSSYFTGGCNVESSEVPLTGKDLSADCACLFVFNTSMCFAMVLSMSNTNGRKTARCLLHKRRHRLGCE